MSVILIEYSAVPFKDGWFPCVTVNGRRMGDTWGKALDKDVALARAKRDAESEAAHYAGDWDIKVRKTRSNPHYGSEDGYDIDAEPRRSGEWLTRCKKCGHADRTRHQELPSSVRYDLKTGTMLCNVMYVPRSGGASRTCNGKVEMEED